MITVQPIGGLCNYLRVIFSYYEYARSVNLELNVIWIITSACPGYFLDYFEPIPHVHFSKVIQNNIKIDYNGCHWHPNFNPYEKNIYNKLKIKSYLKKLVFDKIDILNKNYISVHIRRTDHIVDAKRNNKFVEDEEFREDVIINERESCRIPNVSSTTRSHSPTLFSYTLI